MSAKTVIVAINEAIADVKTTADAAYSPSNPPPEASVVFGSVAYSGDIADHTAPNADLTSGKVTLFTNETTSPHGTMTYTDTVFASPADGDTFRVANLATLDNKNTITFNDGTADVAIIAPGEFVRLVWNAGVGKWLKVSGV